MSSAKNSDWNKIELIEETLRQNKGVFSENGSLIVNTKPNTGRSTQERYIVNTPEIEKEIAWGNVNQKISADKGKKIFDTSQHVLEAQGHYSYQGYVGCFPITVHSTSSWHTVFANNMFRDHPVELQSLRQKELPHIRIFHLPEHSPQNLGIDSDHEKLIILDPSETQVCILGSAYAGEIKKSAFTLCNFLLPKYEILPMHASANCLEDGHSTSVLFGLSGTGKTTLSASPERALIGDDEILWSDEGIANLEGGCYAKLIDLDPKKEPEIYHAVNRFGAVMENVGYDETTRTVDFTDRTHAENTRGSYPLQHLNHTYDEHSLAHPPQTIVFLTADAFGALPAVAKLDYWQSQFHFLLGYTAKVAGTEIGVKEPKATFSACFGAPFMPRPASVYAEMLANRAQKQGASIWLLNTGWQEGGFHHSERFPIHVTRSILKAIQSGELNDIPTHKHEVFGFEVPKECPEIDSKWLNIPTGEAVHTLANAFIEQSQKLKETTSSEVLEKGGPSL